MLAASTLRLGAGHALRVALIVLCLLAVGALSVLVPAAVGLLVLAAGAALRGRRLFQDALLFLVGGSVVLTYGFSNLGLSFGGLPVPLAEIVLLPLVGWCLLRGRSLRSIGPPAVFLAMFLALAVLRLIVDFPEHGALAVRDFTLPIEALMLLVGYWAFNAYGIRWASKLFLIVFLAVVAYGLSFPWGQTLAALGPTVGLQQPVALLGLYDGTGPAVATALIFLLVTLRAPWSVLLGAACLAQLAILQMRGLYLAVPLALVAALLASGRLPIPLPSRLLASVVVAGLILLLVSPLVPSGRLGPVTASFTTSQIGTLLGKEGPGEGSYAIRVEWLGQTLTRLREKPEYLIWGTGLGTDLASGFATNASVSVRKPHNDHVEITARFGLIGLTLWVGLLTSTLLPGWRATRSRHLLPEERQFLVWTLPAITIYLVIAATQPLLAYPNGTVPLFIIMGMILALARQLDGLSAPDGRPSPVPEPHESALDLRAV